MELVYKEKEVCEAKLKLIRETESVDEGHMTIAKERQKETPVVDVGINAEQATKNVADLLKVVPRKWRILR